MNTRMNIATLGRTVLVASAISLLAVPAAHAADSAKAEAAESGAVTGTFARYQQTLPGKYKIYLKDGSVWAGKGEIRKSAWKANDGSPEVTLTQKGSKWVMQLEGSKRKYRVTRVK